MCLGIPGRVVGKLEGYGGQLALVDVAGEHRKVNIGMLPEETFDPGDWVIIHMGFVVEKTDRAGADAALAGLELMGRGAREEPASQPISQPISHGRDLEASP
jgi:hydrogenase expression/formation protein HypC